MDSVENCYYRESKVVILSALYSCMAYDNLCEYSGEICCAHCNSMAGLGEDCTQLFYRYCISNGGESTCMQKK